MIRENDRLVLMIACVCYAAGLAYSLCIEDITAAIVTGSLMFACVVFLLRKEVQ